MATDKTLDLNPQFLKAFDLIDKTEKNVFVTGRAGTGKSTLLEFVKDRVRKHMVVLAPTGVAALNVGGQTIHSFFGFKPDITLAKVKKVPRNRSELAQLYRKIDTIIVDEISMVRADLLDCVDKFMRLNGKAGGRPFGGAQMVFVGDLYQLPPVVTGQEKEIFKRNYNSAFFFDARVFERGFEMDLVELDKIYRQKDLRLIKILNAIRNNTVSDADLKILNARCDPAFDPNLDELYIYLSTTNAMADHVNQERLNRLDEKQFVIDGTISGEFDKKALPTSASLALKVDAQVMLLNNDHGGRWINGSVGRVLSHYRSDGEVLVEVELTDRSVVEVAPFTWKLFKFMFDKESNSIISQEVGSFKQLPIKLAWAITIHKSQGKTFEKVVLDVGWGTFAHGQLYVGLSRCTDLAGLVLKRSLAKSHILLDEKVTEFSERIGQQRMPV